MCPWQTDEGAWFEKSCSKQHLAWIVLLAEGLVAQGFVGLTRVLLAIRLRPASLCFELLHPLTGEFTDDTQPGASLGTSAHVPRRASPDSGDDQPSIRVVVKIMV